VNGLVNSKEAGLKDVKVNVVVDADVNGPVVC